MNKYIFQILIISFIISVIVNLSLKNVDSFSTLIDIILISPFQSFVDRYFDFVMEYVFKPIFGSTTVVDFFGEEIEIVKIPRVHKSIVSIIIFLPLVIMLGVLKVLFELIPDVYKLIRRKIR